VMLFIWYFELVHLFIQVVHVANDISSGREIITSDLLAIDLVGSSVYFQDEAFEIYNDYAFKVGSSVCYHKIRRRARTQDLSIHQFCCWKEGWKENKANNVRSIQMLMFELGAKHKSSLILTQMENGLSPSM